MSRLYMMVTITNRNKAKKMRSFFEEYGNSVLFGTLGKGTATSAILDYFGIEATEKLVTFSIVTNQMWKKLKNGLIDKVRIDVPGTGIAFIVPMGSIGGKKVLQFLIQGQEFEKEEESELKGTEHELIIAIANQGCMDSVMEAARSANAGGGTVIHAKGTGMATAEKFLGVSLAAEKEIVFIVARTEEKNAIMKAIMEKSGLDSKDKAMVFSLPVTSAVGLRMRRNEDEEMV